MARRATVANIDHAKSGSRRVHRRIALFGAA
jgi:hypothetical protein